MVIWKEILLSFFNGINLVIIIIINIITISHQWALLKCGCLAITMHSILYIPQQAALC